MRQSKVTKEVKALAHKVASELPERLLKGDKRVHKASYRKAHHRIELDYIEQSYDQLDGEWREWLDVARRYDHKVPSQDRYDIRHTIIIELHRARQRDGKPIPTLRAYRIASLTVALYWREVNKAGIKVCVYDGVAKEPHCASCSHKPKANRCPWLAFRPVQSLDGEATDSEGNTVRLLDTVANDNAIDLDIQIDASTWLLGCPMRLIQIATKRLDGKPLTTKDRMYLSRYRKQAQKSLF